MERRISTRAPEAGGDTEKPTIRGYAAVFDSLSVDLGGVRERIEPTAFDEALAEEPDVSCRIQHEGGLTTLSRTVNGTLRIGTDETGLWYESDIPNTTAGRDILELVRAGIIDKSSFAFDLRGDYETAEAWAFSPEGEATRTLKRCNLYDVAPVDGPAYPATTVSARAFDIAKSRRTRTETERRLDAALIAQRMEGMNHGS